MNFEWDIAKNRQNIKKHKIDFNTASKVFNDVNRIELYDEKHSEFEDRYIAIGLIEDCLMVVFVSYTPKNDAIRIISARKALPEERRNYYDNKKKY